MQVDKGLKPKNPTVETLIPFTSVYEYPTNHEH
jgi:hypothetical protein